MTMTNATGQLRPLDERNTEAQLQRRNRKTAARRIVAAQLQGQINLVYQTFAHFYTMGFWARLRWVLCGPKRIIRHDRHE